MVYIGQADTETTENTIFTILYRSADGVVFLKRFRINKFIANREYTTIPDGAELLEFTTKTEGAFLVRFVPIKTMRKFEVNCPLDKYAIKGVGAKGYKVTDKEVSVIEFHKPMVPVIPAEDGSTESTEATEEPVNTMNGLPLFDEPKPEEPTDEEV